jgi:hypothetical protein
VATTAIRKLDLKVGEIVEIDDIRYEVVPVPERCEVTLEPVVITVAEEDRMYGTEPLSQEEYDRLSAGLPTDDDQSGER